jgi:serine/threonine protein phosphatase 1
VFGTASHAATADRKAITADRKANTAETTATIHLDAFAWYAGRLVIGVFDDDTPGGPLEILEVRGQPRGGTKAATRRLDD